ncbi:hypothetical protein AWW66_25165 [Micromonospora rosaria]|uniref:Uncharacterized protein n=1 Tax=Micromonospora rosaria TaxID=47874 RepID=A0A136PLL6_9ACTN|nr:hypothetical protein [Micromonospora rosaria]KXK59287.1 hypothetical protein AWW66_25165 [Micromonospora rosaria]
MFLTDPALRRIAADTNDVLPEHVWRHDTATPHPVGDLARILHTTARDFTASTATLDQALTRVGALAHHARRGLATHGDLPVAGYHHTFTDALTARDRHVVLGALLVATYRAWRHHRPVRTTDEQHLLLYPGDPARGVATLRLTAERTWLVLPDAEAANAFAIPYPDRVVGQITETDHGWVPTASTAPRHAQTPPGRAFPLPACDDIPSACRSLLRWWHLRHSDAWRNRTPDQLTPAELAHLPT